MNRQVPPSYHLRYGERRENCPVADFKVLKDVMEVHLDGAVGNIQPAPNFLVRQRRPQNTAIGGFWRIAQSEAIAVWRPRQCFRAVSLFED
jgi:hypothetical protein